MRSDDDPKSPGDLSRLEVLGLLASKIIHDLKNKLAVIAGHAQFAEMARHDAARLASTISTMRRVSEEAGKQLEALAALRRALPEEMPVEDARSLETILAHLLAGWPGWEFHPGKQEGLKVGITGRWLAFLVRHLLACTGAASGCAATRLFSGTFPLEGIEAAGPYSAGTFWLVELRYATPAPEKPESEWPPETRLQHIAVQELVRRLGGVLWRENTGGERRVCLAVPTQDMASAGSPAGTS